MQLASADSGNGCFSFVNSFYLLIFFFCLGITASVVVVIKQAAKSADSRDELVSLSVRKELTQRIARPAITYGSQETIDAS